MRKAFALLFLALLLIPTAVFAQINVADTGLIDTGTEVYGSLTGDQADIGTFLGARVINPLFALIGVIFLILMIAGGLMWMTAGGKMDKAKDARQLMTNGVIGVVIVLASYAITRFVILAVTGGNG